jgi:hypothetical protein
MGERSHDEARILMVLEDEQLVSLPGTLDPEELDPYGDEGQLLSAADQLNQLRERAVAGDLPSPAVPAVNAPIPTSEEPSRKDRRRDRREVRAALKAVRLPAEREPAPEAAPDDEPARPRRLRRGRQPEPAPELMEVAIGEPEPVSVRTPVEPKDEPPGLPSYFPTPVYIPQAEYAQMLRDQKAAERAATEAAAELRRLADLEELDELAKKDEFSDWVS